MIANIFSHFVVALLKYFNTNLRHDVISPKVDIFKVRRSWMMLK